MSIFTNYFSGLALLAKAVFQKRFSLTSYFIAQILFDINYKFSMEHYKYLPAEHLVPKVAGMTVILITTIIVTKIIFKILKIQSTWFSIIFAGILATYGYLFLISFYTNGCKPFAPILQSNPLLGLASSASISEVIQWSGILGLGILIFRILNLKRFLKKNQVA